MNHLYWHLFLSEAMLQRSGALLEKHIAVKWNGPWYVAYVQATSAQDAQPVKFKDVTYQPNYVVKYEKDDAVGDCLLHACNYYDRNEKSDFGTWVLLREKRLASNASSSQVRVSNNAKIGRPSTVRNKPQGGPTSAAHQAHKDKQRTTTPNPSPISPNRSSPRLSPKAKKRTRA